MFRQIIMIRDPESVLACKSMLGLARLVSMFRDKGEDVDAWLLDNVVAEAVNVCTPSPSELTVTL
ncbi:hypothetical protein JCM19235_4702 [Vibrio maritimus]|uniref:Uncharacterized protein n=1 Tax=Vibrio maritimus TaxID=990268 RepID=A0A090S891_9VIBR|nr:hypothetical protein JCM19235_4702 [Vibrio maritimus]